MINLRDTSDPLPASRRLHIVAAFAFAQRGRRWSDASPTGRIRT